MKAREAHAIGGQLVEVRRLCKRMAVTAEIALAEVTGKDEADVWLPPGKEPGMGKADAMGSCVDNARHRD